MIDKDKEAKEMEVVNWLQSHTEFEKEPVAPILDFPDEPTEKHVDKWINWPLVRVEGRSVVVGEIQGDFGLEYPSLDCGIPEEYMNTGPTRKALLWPSEVIVWRVDGVHKEGLDIDAMPIKWYEGVSPELLVDIPRRRQKETHHQLISSDGPSSSLFSKSIA